MSRFFETLKEVSRSQTPGPEAPAAHPNGAPGNPVAETASAPSVAATVVEALQTPRPERATIAQAPAAPPPVIEIPAHVPSLEEVKPRKSEFTGGKKVRVALDPLQALIPNAIDDSVVERYRRLRTKLQQERGSTSLNSLLIASPAPGEGKTVTVLNLAFIFGMLPDFKVVVIDGDLRRGRVGRVLGINGHVGLSNVLDQSARLEDAVMTADDLPFSFLLSGHSDTPPPELLTSPKLGETMRELMQYYDLVLVDSPPVTMFSDAQSLAGSCDGVLLVARAYKTTNKAMERALHDLLPFRIVGTVLNGGANPERSAYYYKGYSRTDA